MDWLIAFLNKTPADLNVLEAGIMLAVVLISGIGVCIMLLKASSAPSSVLRLPTPKAGERNPYLTDDGQLKAGLIQKQETPKAI